MKKNEFYGLLSRIERSRENRLKLEQYETGIDTAYEVMSFIDSQCGIKNKTAVDLGCGNGILGISAAIFGARKVDMYEIDGEKANLAERNVELLQLKQVNTIKKDLFDVNERYDIAVSNPPFGFQSNFSIPAFVKKLLEVADNVFFIYKDNTSMRNLASREGMSILPLEGIKLGRSQSFHKKNSYTLPAILVYRLKQ